MIEWKAADPSASTFSGTRREVLRVGFAETIHGIQQVGFNPTAQPGDQDYGLLYIAAGDGGVVGEGRPNGANGSYGILATNPFVGKPGAALREIYASGLRAAHRIDL